LTLQNIQNREVMRFIHSTEQGFDSSCGLSTLAAFLSIYWGIAATEVSVWEDYLSGKLALDDSTVSFEDMRTVLKAKGFTVAAFKMTWSELVEVTTRYSPLIVHYDEPEGHFALVLSISEDRVVTVDPAEGTVEKDRSAFEGTWSGNVMLARRLGESPNAAFLTEAVKAAAGRRELAEVATIEISRSLQREVSW
jgi:predicted double-glycine peptidase